MKTINYLNLYDNLPIPILVMEVDNFNIIFGNQASKKLFEIKLEETHFIGISTENQFKSESVLDILHQKTKECFESGNITFNWFFKTPTNPSLETAVTFSKVKFANNDQIQVLIHDISKQKNMEIQLRKSEEKIKNYLTNAPNVFTVIDLDGTIRFVNKQNILTGVNSSVRKNIFDILPPKYQAVAQSTISETGKTGKSGLFIHSQIIKGKELWFENRVSCFSENNTQELIIISSNITEQREQQNKLSEKQEELKAIYNSTPVMMSLVNDKFEIIHANYSLVKFLGIPDYDIIGGRACGAFGCINALTDLRGCGFGAECAHCNLRNALEKTLATGETINDIEYHAVLELKNKRREVYFNGSTSIVTIGKTRNILICLLDVSKQKLLGDALNHSELQNKNIIQQIPSCIIIYHNLQIVYANNATLQLINMPNSNNLIGVNPIIFVHDDYKEIAIQRITQCLKENKIADLVYQKFIDLEGNIVDVEVISLPITYEGKRCVMTVFNNITKRKKAEEDLMLKTVQYELQNQEYLQLNEELIQTNEELNEAKQKAEESDRLKSAFIANMSHEIRTPMNAIMGFADLINEPNIKDTKRKLYSEIIVNRSNDLMQIINDILDFSKIEAGAVTLNPETIALNDLLDELYTFYSQKITLQKKNEITLTCSKAYSREQSFLFVDSLKLKQVFSNLLENSLKFTEKGEIRFGYNEISNNQVSCFVSDTGIGIAPKFHSVIFERFGQAETPQNKLFGGTGLGLAICKGNVKLLNGTIWVESELDKGSTFYFTIQKVTALERKKEEIASVTFEQNPWKNKTILVVEDDEFNMALLKEILQKTEARLLFAKNGEETRTFYSQLSEIDIILMDIQLPDTTGIVLSSEIRKLHKSIPIIAQTAYAMNSDRKTCIDAGCNDYITKPIRKSTLITMIDKYLSNL